MTSSAITAVFLNSFAADCPGVNGRTSVSPAVPTEMGHRAYSRDCQLKPDATRAIDIRPRTCGQCPARETVVV
jgi:hypothetical protein